MQEILDIHVIGNIIVVILLSLVALISLLRNKSDSLNQLLFLFFLTGIIHFLFDLWLYISLEVDNLDFINILRDFSLIFTFLGLMIGILAILVIYYGKSVYSFVKEDYILIFVLIISTVMFFVGLTGDSITIHSQGNDTHGEIIRDYLGWVGIFGGFSILTIYFLYIFVKLLKETEGEVRNRLLRLLLGFLFMLTTLLIFDISFSIPTLDQIVNENELIHTLLHLFIISGAFIMLSSFWTPLTKNQNSPDVVSLN